MDRVDNALSIDVEEYFQIHALVDVIPPGRWDAMPSTVEENTRVVLDLLDAHGTRATFFCLGWIAARRPALVRRIRERGHEVACHGYAHKAIHLQDPDEFRRDVTSAKKILEDAVGEEVIGYRAPTYSITQRTMWAIPIIEEAGFAYDSSIFPIYHDTYGIPDAPRFPHRIPQTALAEFPISTFRIAGVNVPVSGGGYFRLLPYPVTRVCLRSLTSGGDPFIFYIHPWELDPSNPAVSGMSALGRFRTYTGLGTARSKFERLLADFRFAPVRDVLREAGLLDAHAQDPGRTR